MTTKHLILVVDDESDIRRTVKEVLEYEGFKVVTANNGQGCLDKLKKIKPKLIILDILMPGLTTKELIAKMRKNKYQIPIIFLSAVWLDKAVKFEIIKKNKIAVAYIEKPFVIDELVETVKKIIIKT